MTDEQIVQAIEADELQIDPVDIAEETIESVPDLKLIINYSTALQHIEDLKEF